MAKGPANILAPHISLYLERREFPPKWSIDVLNIKDDDGHYHPSSHPFLDPRMLYYDRLGARQGTRFFPAQPISASLQMTFACGHLWHGYLGSVLVDMGFVAPENVERHTVKSISNESDCLVTGSGTIDLLDVEIPGHGTWLVDMKTVNKREFEAGIMEFTLKKWQAQVNCYGDWAGREKMMVLAIEKDSPHRMLEVQIMRDENLLSDIYDRWIYTEHHIQEGSPPPCEHAYGAECALEELCSYRAASHEGTRI